MYSLDINFLKDRTDRPTEERYVPTRTTRESQRPVYVGLAAAIFPLALVLGAWWFLGFRNRALEQQSAELDTQLATVQALQQQVTSINTEVDALNTDSKGLATVFDRIKPWSAVLQDIQDRVPAGVQLSKIEQTQPDTPPPAPTPSATPADGSAPAAEAPPPAPPASKIAITGLARSFSDVNDFLLTLQRSPFLQGTETRLVTATLIDNPTTIEFADENNSGDVQVKLPQVVQYTIESNLTDLPASELLQDLERNLAVGLAARIEALRNKGVLTP